MNILIDYLTISIKNISLTGILNKLKIKEDDCKLNNSCWGRFGMTGMYWFNGIKIHFGNYIIIDLSGSGCRTLETLYHDEFDWCLFISELMDLDGHISRLDIAIDDKDNLLNFKTMFNSIDKNKYVSQARNISIIKGTKQEEIIIGSPSSDKLVRIYNKSMERGFSADTHWIRCEMQLRNDCAFQFFYHWYYEKMDIGMVAGGMLLNYFRFTAKPYDKMNPARYPSVNWWLKFLNTTTKIKNVLIGGLIYNEYNVIRYIEKQAASTIKTFIGISNGDLTPLLELVEGVKLNDKQKLLLYNLMAEKAV